MMGLEARHFLEKRNYIRMQMDAPSRITTGTPPQSFPGLCKNLSGDGMLLEMEHPLPVGAIAFIHLPSQRRDFSDLEATFTVNRIERIAGHRFIIGATLLRVQGNTPIASND